MHSLSPLLTTLNPLKNRGREARLRLLSFNIAHGRGLSPYQGLHCAANIHKKLKRIADLLVSWDVDIAALQEVDEHSYWNHGINLLDVLKKEANFPEIYLGAHNRREGKRPLLYGNGILGDYVVWGETNWCW